MAYAPTDRSHMEAALRLAIEGQGRVEPNPMVGAVLTRRGRIVARGVHRRFGGPHAEAACLKDARSRGVDTEGATIYVTLEPCTHEGKTPPCAPALVKAGVGRVVVAVEDPLWQRHARQRPAGVSPRRGIEMLRGAGVEVDVGLLRQEAIMLNAPFFKGIATGQPLVIAKWAMSIDGKIATRTGSSRWISCERSRRRVQEIRGRVDAVIIGSGTARRDDPRLTCRQVEPRRDAARVVLCGSSAPAPDSKLARSAGELPVILAHRADAPPAGLPPLLDVGCESLPLPAAPGRSAAVDPRAVLEALGERGFTNVLVEGGRDVLGSLFDARLVDRCLVFLAPRVIGGAGAVTAVGGEGAESVRDAVPLLGPTRPADDDRLPPEPETTVHLSGSDLLLEGWASDPRRWPEDTPPAHTLSPGPETR